MSLGFKYFYVCNICGQETPLVSSKPPGWEQNREGEHRCPDCITQNKELHPHGRVFPAL